MHIRKNNFKKITSLLFFLCISSFMFSQYAEVNATITYTYELPKLFYEHDYKLIVKNRISKYQRHQEKESHKAPNGMLVELSKSYFDWYFDAQNKKITEQRVMGNDTKLLAKWDANLKWKITKETKEINGYKVQKAITKAHLLDSTYPDGDAIAWFAPEIPISSGPERYYGLPGLILKIEYTESTQVTTVKDIKFDEVEEIKIPTEGIPMTKDETLRFELRTNKWLKNKKKQENK